MRDFGLPLLLVTGGDPKQANVLDITTDTDHLNKETHMNSQNLIRWAGLSALVAGICFVAMGLLHPPDILSSVTTTRWAITHALAIAMSVFGLLGMTGLYARQVEAAGWLGLAGYLLWSLFLVLFLPFNFFEAFSCRCWRPRRRRLGRASWGSSPDPPVR